MGHVLGLVHEVKRPDRPAHVLFHCLNVQGATPACCEPNPCCGLVCEFSVDNGFDHTGPYRTTSIMHYRRDAFAIPGTLTLEGLNGEVVPLFNPSNPDIEDYKRICKIYFEECKGVCGNGILEPANGEECDNGDSNGTGACSSTCKKVSVCGNGILEPGEECDDGNLINGDGCSSTCKKEVICPTCNPIVGLNHCDITTSCITTAPGQHHCACRAGFKSNALDSQTAIHFRLPFPGQEYRVFVAPGVACDTLCNNPFGAPQDICTEVPLVSTCS
jgi:cysteine-rich repeat protein